MSTRSIRNIVKKYNNIFVNFKPIEKCILLQAILEKNGYSYSIIQGYVNTDIEDTPLCCTYVWLQNYQTEDKIFPIKTPFERSFVTENILSGVTCIDQYESCTISDIQESLKNRDKLKKKHKKLLEK